MKKHSRALTYLITAVVGLAMAVAVLQSRGGFSQPDTMTMYFVMSDACFVPGIILTGFGILLWAAHDGFFDGLTYSVSKLTTLLLMPFRKKERYQQYYDYKVEKAARRQKPGWAVLIVGVVFLALAGFFLVLMQAGGYELLPKENPAALLPHFLA